jgi:hypothetical protein
MNQMMMAFSLSSIDDMFGKCPPHAIYALAGAFVIGLLVGIIFTKVLCSKKKAASCGTRRPHMGASQRFQESHSGPTRVAIPAGSVEIYAGNLSYDLTEEGLRKEFEAFGTVASARVVVNHFNNRAKGFGFVVMPNRAEAEKAIAALNDKDVLGRKMRVNEARNTIKEG